jgi:hypothetical protein
LAKATQEGASDAQVIKFLQIAKRDMANRETTLREGIDRIQQRLDERSGKKSAQPSTGGGSTNDPLGIR